MDNFSKQLNDVYAELSTSPEGLTAEEAKTRLEKNGKNELDEGKKKSFLAK
ncbi:MAG: cation-transporting P-type ATPase, partial [Clostridia bacterium]